ncbi:MAG: DNA repair exonuclease [Calditrichia bacterium]
MPLKIFHTADVHLGMKFTRGYPAAVQQQLIEARFKTLHRMVNMANERDADLFAVAGDLIDNQKVAKKDIIRAAAILKDFSGKLVLILPGNHDFSLKDELNFWNIFKENMGENTLLLEEGRPYDLRQYDLNVMVYPGPCHGKHSRKNSIGWVAQAPKSPEIDFHLGMAHGSLDGLSPDFNADYFPMTREELRQSGVDLWLLGHTHIRYPAAERGQSERIFFPATPEPDGFDCAHPGYAWIIELDSGKEIKYESVKTGEFRFVTLEETVIHEQSIEKIVEKFKESDSGKTLLKLKLSGRIPGELFENIGKLIPRLGKMVLYLEADTSRLLRKISPEDIDREFTQDSFPHRLLTSLAAEGRNPLSLQIAYDLIRGEKI